MEEKADTKSRDKLDLRKIQKSAQALVDHEIKGAGDRESNTSFELRVGNVCIRYPAKSRNSPAQLYPVKKLRVQLLYKKCLARFR